MSSQLIDIIERLPAARIVLAGDLMLDRYIFGSVERISPEAPVPVLHFQQEEYRLGGAGFVMATLVALGAKVSAIGMVGKDEAGRELRRRVEQHTGTSEGLIELAGRPTVMKVRLLGSSQDRTPQQIIRLDIEESGPAGAECESRIIERIEKSLEGAELLCLEDYNKGVLTAAVCRRAIALAREKKIPVIIDPANIPDYSKYAGATALKLNRPEAERATGLPCRSAEQYRTCAMKLLESLGLEAVVITLNELGSFLATADGEGRLLQTRPRQVADATGAGDMVLAMLCMARAGGATWAEAAALANIAGGLEVENVGCVPITRQEIIRELLTEIHEHLGKRRTLEQLLPELQQHRLAGRRIVFTNGCFDLIHLGHVQYFRFAKQQGDLLIVAVNTDASIRRLKGEKRPIIHEQDRISVLEELESIDYLIEFDDDTPMRLIEQIRPDVLVKGADYSKEKVVGWELVESYGGRVALAPLVDGRSTSAVINRILDAYR
ncbi:MAG TPA: D-glycero-beta-D-manno-heptose 1-phosphate adenylyltransferase [Tepidisphaeraceae bacterium]|jgi:D-beta-D-heptose 7-phosphate kinase/D-beta-D-heptose 1-phosphate adenosyltransferase